VVGDVGSPASSKYLYSSDGITWSASNTVSGGAARDVTFGNNIFVAVIGGGCSNMCVNTSSDGITWTQRSTPLTENFRSVVYANNRFYVVSVSGNTITSTDGTTWTQGVSTPTSTEEISYGASRYVYVNNGSIYSSANFSTWSLGSGFPASKNWQHIIYADSKFVAVAYDGTILYSTDGIVWSTSVSGLPQGGFIAFGNNIFVALSWGNRYAYSTNTTPTAAAAEQAAAAAKAQQDHDTALALGTLALAIGSVESGLSTLTLAATRGTHPQATSVNGKSKKVKKIKKKANTKK
jgi:hypothetical protein